MSLPVQIDWESPALEAAVEAHLLHVGVSVDDLESRAQGLFCYLATPYSRRVLDRQGVWSFERSAFVADLAAFWSGNLALRGVLAISPIAHAHAMIAACDGQNLYPLDQEFWTRWCAPLLGVVDAVIVPPIAGWRESTGVWHEVRETLGFQRQVFIMEGL